MPAVPVVDAVGEQYLPFGRTGMPVASDPVYIETMNRIYGFDRPLPEQYLRYIGNVLRGDLGVSIDNPTKPVGQILVSRLPATMELTAATLVFALGIGIPLGIVSALHRNKLADHLASAGSSRWPF